MTYTSFVLAALLNFPDWELNPCPLQWKHRDLTTRPPEKSNLYLTCFFFFLAMPHGMWDLSSPESESVSHSVMSDSKTPMDCSPPGSSVHGILQARILEWVYISSFRVSSPPRDQTQGFCIAGRFPFPGMGLMPTAVEAQSLKHWTSREVQIHPFLK